MTYSLPPSPFSSIFPPVAAAASSKHYSIRMSTSKLRLVTLGGGLSSLIALVEAHSHGVSVDIIEKDTKLGNPHFLPFSRVPSISYQHHQHHPPKWSHNWMSRSLNQPWRFKGKPKLNFSFSLLVPVLVLGLVPVPVLVLVLVLLLHSLTMKMGSRILLQLLETGCKFNRSS